MSRPDECLSFELISEYVSVEKKDKENHSKRTLISRCHKKKIDSHFIKVAHTRKEHSPILVYQTIKFR